MTAPLISIVLPVYNGARYLGQAIESILAQDYVPWELIVVDDASTDETPGIISSFVARDSRITGIRNPENRRLPGSLNAGFARAHGDLLTWTSDDNYYRFAALTEMARTLQQRPEVDLVYASYTLIDANGRTRGEVQSCHPKLLGFRNTVGACFLYRRRVYERLGNYNESLFLVEDYEYWVRTMCQFQVARMEANLYCYRVHDGSLTAQRKQAIDEAREAMLVRYLSHLHWLTPDERGLVCFELARLATSGNRRSDARGFLRRAILGSPRLLFLRHRRAIAGRLLATVNAESSVADSITWTASRSRELHALAIHAHLGGLALRWYYRIANTCAHPAAAMRRLASALHH